MPDFEVNGIRLTIPQSCMTPHLRKEMQSGRYESAEMEALVQHLHGDDRVLDLGAGAGYISTLAGLVAAAGGVAGVEANPEMVEAARANLAGNGVAGAELLWGAVVPDDFAADTVPFTLRRAFWASGIAREDEGAGLRRVDVPALRLGPLLQRFSPTVLIVDIEGGEEALFDRPLPPQLRLVVIELHLNVYGSAGVKRIFDGLSASGLSYCPKGSRGKVVVLQRVGAAAD
jgi:FkbM family methyltransferase